MSNMSTVAHNFSDSFYQVVVDMFKDDPQVLVSDGHPGTATNDDLIVFIDVKSTQVEANLSITNRSREETLEQHIYVSSFRAGELDNDRVPKKRVYELLGQIENYVRTTDTTLGGAVRQCFLTEHQSKGATEPAIVANGRQVDCYAIFTALARISN